MPQNTKKKINHNELKIGCYRERKLKKYCKEYNLLKNLLIVQNKYALLQLLKRYDFEEMKHLKKKQKIDNYKPCFFLFY